MAQANEEIIRHGTREVNLAFYDHPFPAPDDSFNAHWHQELEINYVYDGPVTFLVDGAKHVVPSGDLIFVNRNLIHSCQAPSTYRGRYASIVFGEKFVFSAYGDALYNMYLAPLYERKLCFPTRLPPDLPCREALLHEVRELLENYFTCRYGYEIAARAHLLAFYQLAMEAQLFVRESKVENATSHLVKNAMRLIQEQYTMPIPVKRLASELGVTPEYLSRIFKSAIGKTPMEFILSCRIEHAQFLLTQSDIPIGDIAAACGFEDFNYFSRFFKKWRGMPPSVYRKLYQKKPKESQ